MLIDTDYAGLANRSKNVANASGGDFSAAFRQALGQSQASAPAAESDSSQQTSATEKPSARETLLKSLQEYLDKGPMVLLREKIMKKLGLTEEKLAAMTPDERQAAEAAIAKEMREYLLGRKEDGPQSEQAADASRPLDGTTGRSAAAAVGDAAASIGLL